MGPTLSPLSWGTRRAPTCSVAVTRSRMRGPTSRRRTACPASRSGTPSGRSWAARRRTRALPGASGNVPKPATTPPLSPTGPSPASRLTSSADERRRVGRQNEARSKAGAKDQRDARALRQARRKGIGYRQEHRPSRSIVGAHTHAHAHHPPTPLFFLIPPEPFVVVEMTRLGFHPTVCDPTLFRRP
jgi:hypothetical protein